MYFFNSDFSFSTCPFASSLPDGLEKIGENFGVKTEWSYWNGLMSNYLIESIKNSTISTFISGIIGGFAVPSIALLLGKSTLDKKKGHNIQFFFIEKSSIVNLIFLIILISLIEYERFRSCKK